LRTFLSRWLIRNALVYSIGFNCLIHTPNKWSNLSYKVSTMLYATYTRMQNLLWKLIVSMLWFVVVGCHQGLLQRQMPMSLQIGLTFGIFMSSNGEVSWSMWTFHLRTSHDFLSFLFIQNWNSIYTWVPFVLWHFRFCLSFPLFWGVKVQWWRMGWHAHLQSDQNYA
jgi:hypothetical protein